MTEKNRKRGAQIGNLNALKHGHYSKKIYALDVDAVAELLSHDLVEEARVIRAMLSRHLHMRQAQPPQSPDETLTDLRVISFAVGRLTSIVRLAHNLPPEEAESGYSENWMEELMDEILTESEGSDNPDEPGFTNDLL